MVRAKKYFGQNFLKDEIIISKIIESIPKNVDKIIEIGPGLGDLTSRLISIAHTISYEIDKDLVDILHNKFSNDIKQNRLNILFEDVISVIKNKGLSQSNYILVSNLPYYISTNIVLYAIEDKFCKDIIVMVQKEVAQKFCASVNNKQFGAISVIASLFCDCKILFEVDKTSFVPQPKVTSAVMRLTKRDNVFEDIDLYQFKKFLSYCFASPRKMIVKNLSSYYKNDCIVDVFNMLNLSLNLRAHEIDVDLFLNIFKLLKVKHG